MKRLWASVIILIVLGVVCIFGAISTSRISNDLTNTIESAKKAAEDGDNSKAFTLSKKAVSDWHQSHEVLCTYMPHAKLEAIDQTLAAMPSLIYYGTTDQFTAECDRSVTQIEYLNESETPILQNIF